MTTLARWLNTLGVCAATGMVVGVLAGFAMEMAQLAFPGSRLTAPGILRAGLVLGVAGWLLALVLIGLIGRFGAGAMALPALVTSLVVAVVTVFVDNAVRRPVLSLWLGLIIGLVVGRAFCLAWCYRHQLEAGTTCR